MSEVTTVSPQIEDSWKHALQSEFSKDYFAKLKAFLVNEKQKKIPIYPKGSDIFNAFNLTPYDQVKVVILGQDPYHGPNQAHGLAFSVQPGVALPPSLKNIFKELATDIGFNIPKNGDLRHWAKQGVLLLNTVLTVRAGQAHSHRGHGWEHFTDAVIKKLSSDKKHLVFVLWGAPAQTKQQLIDQNKHLILKAAHPSPLSAHRGFLGCRHFSKINEYLSQNGELPIEW